jgi:hypothetical protein
VRNSSLVKCLCAENEAGLKPVTESADSGLIQSGRGASHVLRRWIVRSAGAHGSENAGMSSEKRGENPLRRKPKVS